MARKSKVQIREEKLIDQGVKIQKFVKVLQAREQARWAEKGLKMSQVDADAFALGYLISMTAQGMLDSKKFRDMFEDRNTFVELSAKELGVAV